MATTIVLSSVLIPLISYAEGAAATATTPTTSTASEMSKDSWLGAMTPLLPDLICKGFIQDPDLKKRFDELKLTYDQCVTLIPESCKKCQSQIYAQIPEKVNSDSAGVWGKALGECIGRDFAEKYLIPKK